MAELFRESRQHLFPGDPSLHLDQYRELTEFSLLTDVRRWHRSQNPELQRVGALAIVVGSPDSVAMVCQRNLSFGEGQSESSSVFSSPHILTECVREQLPAELKKSSVPSRFSEAHPPAAHFGATAGLNFYYDSSSARTLPLTTHGLYRKLPISHTIARIYARL
ncbi:MAG: hypothetical protein R3C09_17620 [Pirellulaceae bacterium]